MFPHILDCLCGPTSVNPVLLNKSSLYWHARIKWKCIMSDHHYSRVQFCETQLRSQDGDLVTLETRLINWNDSELKGVIILSLSHIGPKKRKHVYDIEFIIVFFVCTGSGILLSFSESEVLILCCTSTSFLSSFVQSLPQRPLRPPCHTLGLGFSWLIRTPVTSGVVSTCDCTRQEG